MAIPDRSNTTYGVRSISFPTRSHASTHKIQKQLNDIKTWVLSSSLGKPSADLICDALLKLSRVYECMDELIDSLSLIPNSILRQQNESWIEDLMDRSVGFLDACGITRDMVSQVKEHVRDLQCALRRRKGDSSIENSVARYNCFSKKTKKDVKGVITCLKQSMVSKSDDQDNHHHHHDHLTRIVAEVMDVTVSVFESILTLFVVPHSRTPKATKWSLVVSKLRQKKRVACEEHHHQQHSRATSDFKGLDIMLLNLGIKDGLSPPSSLSFAKCQLEAMDVKIERIESGLEGIYRRLIRTRVSLLNIVSHL